MHSCTVWLFCSPLTLCRLERLWTAELNRHPFCVFVCCTLRLLQHVPFRESKLTHYLQAFFCGRGKACMIVNINQCASMYDETLNVLKFSAVAQKVLVVFALLFMSLFILHVWVWTKQHTLKCSLFSAVKSQQFLQLSTAKVPETRCETCHSTCTPTQLHAFNITHTNGNVRRVWKRISSFLFTITFPLTFKPYEWQIVCWYVSHTTHKSFFHSKYTNIQNTDINIFIFMSVFFIHKQLNHMTPFFSVAVFYPGDGSVQQAAV